MTANALWLGIGFLGQTFFALRILCQWIVSERRGESVVPVYFWYFSILGGVTLFIYATHRLDPVFMVGEATGVFIYVRNLVLIRRREGRRPMPPS